MVPACRITAKFYANLIFCRIFFIQGLPENHVVNSYSFAKLASNQMTFTDFLRLDFGEIFRNSATITISA